MAESLFGAAVKRVEDQRFITGNGNYVDDINRPGQLYAYILRSPHAHARLNSVDTGAAKAADGVVAVFTGDDMQVGGLPCGWQIHSQDGSPMVEPPHPALAQGKVRYVGDQVAVVIADSLTKAKDAAEADRCGLRSSAGACGYGQGHAERRRARARRGPEKHLLRLGAGREGPGRPGICFGPHSQQDRSGEQSADPQRHGATGGDRRL